MKEKLSFKRGSKYALVLPFFVASLLLAGCSSDDDSDMDSDVAVVDGAGENTDNTGTGTGTDTETETETDTDAVDTEDNTDAVDAAAGSKVIIAATALDFTSAAVEIYNVTEPRDGQTNLNPGVSDTIVRAFEDNYFVIRRFQSDSIAAYSVTDPSAPIFESSTNDGNDPESSNPHDLVFVDNQKAYLLRYGSPVVWVVNPSASDASQFKIGEIDLSAYDSDGVPDITRGVVVGDRLFILMQRLENNYVPTQAGYVAVIDINNNTEIDTGSDGELKGIQLPAFNPWELTLDPATDSLFVAAVGDFGAFDGSRDPAYSGGIVTIDTQDYSSNLLLDDTDDTGRIIAVEVFDAGTAYMITQTSYQVNSLVRFNPGTGVIEETGVAGLEGLDLRDIAKGPAGNLWVAVGSVDSPRVVILNPADGTTAATQIDTVYNPSVIAFTR